MNVFHKVYRKFQKINFIFSLLQSSAEFIASGSKLGPHAKIKRKMFIRGYNRLLISAASRYKALVTTENVKFRKVICQVLDDMENVLKSLRKYWVP